MTAVFQIIFKRSAQKDIRRIPQSILQFIYEHIEALATNPLPPGVKPVSGYDNYYRIRIGQYRVIYELSTSIRIIFIARVGHRKDIYKHF